MGGRVRSKVCKCQNTSWVIHGASQHGLCCAVSARKEGVKCRFGPPGAQVEGLLWKAVPSNPSPGCWAPPHTYRGSERLGLPDFLVDTDIEGRRTLASCPIYPAKTKQMHIPTPVRSPLKCLLIRGSWSPLQTREAPPAPLLPQLPHNHLLISCLPQSP